MELFQDTKAKRSITNFAIPQKHRNKRAKKDEVETFLFKLGEKKIILLKSKF